MHTVSGLFRRHRMCELSSTFHPNGMAHAINFPFRPSGVFVRSDGGYFQPQADMRSVAVQTSQSEQSCEYPSSRPSLLGLASNKELHKLDFFPRGAPEKEVGHMGFYPPFFTCKRPISTQSKNFLLLTSQVWFVRETTTATATATAARRTTAPISPQRRLVSTGMRSVGVNTVAPAAEMTDFVDRAQSRCCVPIVPFLTSSSDATVFFLLLATFSLSFRAPGLFLSLCNYPKLLRSKRRIQVVTSQRDH